MITGRGPGAPGVTPDMVFTLYGAARGAPGGQAVDLSEIRRSDAIMDLLASRRLMRPRAVHDPAIALLSALAADVDSPATEDLAAPTGHRGAGQGRPVPAADTWVRVAAAVAVAGAAATTGIMVTGMLARLARMGLSQPGRPVGGARPAALARRAATTRTRGTR